MSKKNIVKAAVVAEEIAVVNAEAEEVTTDVVVTVPTRANIDAKLEKFNTLKNDKNAKAEDVDNAEDALKDAMKAYNTDVRIKAYKALESLTDMFTKKSFSGVLKLKKTDDDNGFVAEIEEGSELFSIARVKSYPNLALADKGWKSKIAILVNVLNNAFAAETEVGELSDEFKKLFKGDTVETVSTNKLTAELQNAFDAIIFSTEGRDDGKNKYTAKKCDARLLKAGAFDFKDARGKFVPATSKRVINLLTLLLCRTVGGNAIEVIEK